MLSAQNFLVVTSCVRILVRKCFRNSKIMLEVSV